jgi:phosphoglycolate phosphatase
MLTLVFDLDGTLVDTAPDLIATLNLILEREGLPAVAYDDARKLIGGGARGMIARALEADGRRPQAKTAEAKTAETKTAEAKTGETQRALDRMFDAFIDHYSAHIADRSRPYPELETTLDRLAGAGHRLAVCTNKLEWLSVKLLDTLKLTRHFGAICGQDTFGIQKPDPEVLRRTIAKVGGTPERAIMIGDSGTDICTARAASVPVIAVDFGYTDVPIASLNPDRLIGSYAELPAAIAHIEAARS